MSPIEPLWSKLIKALLRAAAARTVAALEAALGAALAGITADDAWGGSSAAATLSLPIEPQTALDRRRFARPDPPAHRLPVARDPLDQPGTLAPPQAPGHAPAHHRPALGCLYRSVDAMRARD